MTVPDVRSVPLRSVAGRTLAILSILLVAGCSSKNAIRDGTATAVQPVADLPPPDPRDVGGGMQDVYYIGPQDKLAITVVDLPELTREALVDPTGQINLPYVGAIQAGGRTAAEVREQIRSRLAESVLERPDVTVAIADTVSQRVTLEGAVGSPGIYPIAGQTSLLRSIALARGTSSVANERVVAVFRVINGKQMAAVFDLNMIRDGRMADPVVYGNDVIVVERSRGKVILRDIIGTLPLVGAFAQVDRVVTR